MFLIHQKLQFLEPHVFTFRYLAQNELDTKTDVFQNMQWLGDIWV